MEQHRISLLRGTLLKFFAVLAIAGVSPATAGSLAVSPLRITFSGNTGIASLTIDNNGTEEALVQAETFAWTQSGGENKLAATDDVVAVPPIFKLAPGEKQRIRVGLTRAISGDREQAYRITITEIPTMTAPGTVAVAVRHSLPIFVLPAAPISPRLTVKVASPGMLEVTNSGTQHLRIQRWRFHDGAGAVVAEAGGPGYLLAGASQALRISANNFIRPAVFEADSDTKTLKIVVAD